METWLIRIGFCAVCLFGFAATMVSLPVFAGPDATLLVIADTGDCGEGPPKVAAALRKDPALASAWLLEVGDLAYPSATLERMVECHEPHFGPAIFPRRLAVPGNHDAQVPGMSGFLTVFPEPVPRFVDFGNWRLLLLDSNLRRERWVAQLDWIDQAIGGAAGRCVLAAWHHPAWSSGKHGDDASMLPLWHKIAARVSVSIHGHDHHYERLAPKDAAGIDAQDGTTSFIVGNGGAPLYFVSEGRHGSPVADAKTWGFLRLELDGETYRWAAVGVSGEVIDQGSARCRPAPR